MEWQLVLVEQRVDRCRLRDTVDDANVIILVNCYFRPALALVFTHCEVWSNSLHNLVVD